MAQQNHRFYAHELDGAILKSNSQIELTVNSDLDIQVVELNGNKYLQEKNIKLSSKLVIDSDKGDVILSEFKINLNASGFLGKGNFNYKNDAYNINIEANKTDFKTVISLLPNSISNSFQQYHTKGDASFNLSIIKKEDDKDAQINADFGCKNVSLHEPKTNKDIADLNFTGNFTNGTKRNSTTSVLTLKNLKGKFDNNPFEGYLTYKNFSKPFIDTYIKGEFPVSFFTQFSDSSKINNVKGSVVLDVKLKAFQSDIESNNQEKINSSGEIVLKKISLENDNGFYKFNNLNGSFIFNKNDVAFSEFTGEINNSDFTLNGYLKGFFQLFFE